MIVVAAAIGVYDFALPGASTLYVATKGFTTTPGATPANTHFAPRLLRPALPARNAFASGTTMGRIQARIGDLVLVNNAEFGQAGELDGWIDYGFDGQTTTVYVFDDEEVGYDPADWTLLGVFSSEQLELRRDTLTIKMRDKAAIFDVPVQATLYGGGGGLDGGAELEGKPKPILLGAVRNITPVLVDAPNLIFHVAADPTGPVDVTAVYEGGDDSGITQGVDYPDQATLLSTPPAAGTYRVWPDGGYFRLGSSPARLITCDAECDTSYGGRSVGQVVSELAYLATGAGGPGTVVMDATALTAMDAANNDDVGIWVGAQITNAAPLMDQVANTAGAFWGFLPDDSLSIRQLLDPAGESSVHTFTQNDMLAPLERVPVTDKDRGFPYKRLIMRYDRNWTVQTSDLGGGVTDERRALLAQEWTTQYHDVSQPGHPLASTLVLESLFVDGAAASAEFGRQEAMRQTLRHRFTFEAPLTTALLALDLGDTVTIQHPRFGLSAGKKFAIIGIEPKFTDKSKTIAFDCWGGG